MESGNAPPGDPIKATDATRSIAPDLAALPPELAEALEGYLAALEAGESPSREALLAKYPHLAGAIAECLSAIEFIHGAARKLPGPQLYKEAAPAHLGDFRLLREIGSGGMGVVYEAEQVSLGRHVALKVLRLSPVGGSEALQRFQREAATVARLHHTNIVPVFAVGVERGVHYYAMQLIAGSSLADVAAQARDAGTQIDPQLVARWGLAAAEALEHAHLRGIIHRDVKPSNLLLDREGRVWLTDFGLARRLDDVSLSLSGIILGTPRYMSPEQAAATKTPIDHRSDLYSLGVSLYELLTGKPAFDAETPQAVISQILAREPVPARLLRPDLPLDLDTIVTRCLNKEPAGRYATAQELAEDLRAFIEGRDIRARRPTIRERASRWLRRNRRQASSSAAAAGIAAALVVSTLLAWRGWDAARHGTVKIEAGGIGLVGELVDSKGNQVTGSFAVPTAEPIAIVEGMYDLRLSSPGLPSETVPVEVERGQETAIALEARRRWLWPPLEVRSEEHAEPMLVELAGHADLLLLSHAVESRNTPENVRRLRRFDGATGKLIWSLDFDDATTPAGMDSQEWKLFLAYTAQRQQDRFLLEPTADLTGDGVRDTVWLSRTTPALLALDGADGKLLWRHRGRPLQQPNEDVANTRWSSAVGQGGVVGSPLLVNADGDGIQDVIACFASAGEGYEIGNQSSKTTKQSWLETISGKTGKPLWRRSVPSGAVASSKGTQETRQQDQLTQLRLAQVNSIPLVIHAVHSRDDGAKLHAYTLATGADAWPAIALGDGLPSAPTVTDLDGDGEPEAIVVSSVGRWIKTAGQNGEIVQRNASDAERLHATVRAFSLHRRSLLWQSSFVPTQEPNELESGAAPRWLVKDVNGDGQSDILVATGEPQTRAEQRRFGGVRRIDGSTGTTRWEKFLCSRPLDRLVTGPDLDADQTEDVFVSWHEFVGASGKTLLGVAALSGSTGNLLWSWRHEVSPAGIARDRSETMLWWQPGRDGLPTLLVPTTAGPGQQATTFVLESKTGRLAERINGVHAHLVADMTGEGIPDLAYFVAPQDAPRLVAVPGSVPSPWSALGNWLASGDFDDDGYTDLFRVDGSLTDSRILVRSGQDRSELWRVSLRGSLEVLDHLALPPPWGDFDGDGRPDFLLLGRLSNSHGSGPNAITMFAFRGADGRLLWTQPSFGHGSGSGLRHSASFRYPAMTWVDLNGDLAAEILVSHADNGAGIQLAAIEAARGNVLWRTPISWVAATARGELGPARCEDLNGDGWRDPVVWASEARGDGEDPPCRLEAINGKDGKRLWKEPPVELKSSAAILAPHPVCSDLDGDGRAEIITAWRDPSHDDRDHYRHLVAALDGASGKKVWTWSVASTSFECLPPRVVDFEGNQRPFVCFGYLMEKGPRIVVLASDGQPRQEIKVKHHLISLDQHIPLWQQGDLNADGREELLILSDGQLHAWRLGENPLWSWKLPWQGALLTEIRRPASGVRKDAKSTGGTPPFSSQVVVWYDRHVLGLDGGDGRPRWRADTLMAPHPAASLVRLTAGRDALNNDTLLPRFLCELSEGRDTSWSTRVSPSWPTDAAGKILAPGKIAP